MRVSKQKKKKGWLRKKTKHFQKECGYGWKQKGWRLPLFYKDNSAITQWTTAEVVNNTYTFRAWSGVSSGFSCRWFSLFSFLAPPPPPPPPACQQRNLLLLLHVNKGTSSSSCMSTKEPPPPACQQRNLIIIIIIINNGEREEKQWFPIGNKFCLYTHLLECCHHPQ